MDSLGDLLRDAREQRGVSLEDVEKTTHIRAKHLAALETGDWAALPSPVQARGFLRNYAQYLGLDADAILGQYAGALHQLAPRPQTAAPRRAMGQPASGVMRPRWFSTDLVVAAVITLALIGLFVWGGARLATTLFGSDAATTPVPTVGAAPASTAAAPEPTLALIGGATATPSPPPPLESFTNVNITIVVQQRSWLRVLTDGEEAFSGMAVPGQTLEFAGDRLVEVLTGNGAGLHVTFNGREVGTLGGYGEVVDRLWTLQGMLTPTPSLTPTATEASDL